MTQLTKAQLAGWTVPLAIAVCCLVIGVGGEAARQWGEYHREALAAGELWRLLTGHLVHLGWGHLWLNLTALMLIRILFEDRLSQWEWLGTTLTAALAIDLGLYAWDERVIWYVGLSGVLHGVVAYGTVKLLRERAAIGALLALGLIVKLVWEQTSGPIPFSESSSGGPVVVAAHLYGTAGGLLAAVVYALARRHRARDPVL